jgi:hypothetical protein
MSFTNFSHCETEAGTVSFSAAFPFPVSVAPAGSLSWSLCFLPNPNIVLSFILSAPGQPFSLLKIISY